MHRNTTLLNVMKTILNITIASEKQYKEKLVATRIVDIVEYLIVSDFLTGIRAQSSYRLIRVAKMLLRYESILALL